MSGSLLYFLRASNGRPAADKVRVHLPNGENRILVIDHKSKRPFSSALKSIEALDAVKVEALDPSGNVLRATDIEVQPAEDEPTEPGAPSAPASPLQSDLQYLAALLADAYRHGAENAEKQNKEAFNTLASLNKTAFDRLEGFEKAWTRMFNAQERQLRAEGKGEEDAGESIAGQVLPMLAGLVGQKLAGAASPSPSPSTNGQPKKEPS